MAIIKCSLTLRLLFSVNLLSKNRSIIPTMKPMTMGDENRGIKKEFMVSRKLVHNFARAKQAIMIIYIRIKD